MHATYCLDDNKLRLYPSARLDAETYNRAKKLGFKWAPKQELFVCPAWSPGAEDFLLELCEEIEDESYTPEERAADRAERFEGYRGNRVADASSQADRFDSAGSVFGHQNAHRAERQANRAAGIRRNALSHWSRAEYWLSRTQAVISHALYKARPEVRRSRIKRLEADLRKSEHEAAEQTAVYDDWLSVPTRDGATVVTPCDADPTSWPDAYRLAYRLANYFSHSYEYKHPRTGEESSLWSHLTDNIDPITPAEAAALALEGRSDPRDPESWRNRWTRHYQNRLAFERAMLANEGGTAAAAEMEPGGWVLGRQIHAVNRSPATRQIVSVKIMAPHPWREDDNGAPIVCLQSLNIERLGADAYRPPTDEERAAFAEAKTAKKAATKRLSILNPDAASAAALQALWNSKAKTPGEVTEMTQAHYTRASQGDGWCAIVMVDESGQIVNTAERAAFKVRRRGYFTRADELIVITDKPRKPLPLAELVAQ